MHNVAMGNGTNKIRVYISNLATPLLTPLKQAGVLQDAEVQRLNAMHSPKRQHQFVNGRQLLRHALSHTYGGSPQDWQIKSLENGQLQQPYHPLRPNSTEGTPVIGLSHSGDWTACIIGTLSRLGRLGIDIQCCKPRKQGLAGLIDAVLHPKEIAELSLLSEEKQRAHFYRLWALKESLAKALGVGLAMPFREFAFNTQNQLVAAHSHWVTKPAHWGFRSISPAQGVTLAIAWAINDGEENSKNTPELRFINANDDWFSLSGQPEVQSTTCPR